ncbi:hypothetical protein LCGC14_1528260, partial [marine sediment metagenome]
MKKSKVTNPSASVEYDETYFERGLESGISCYQNYRWIPELTIPLAMTLIDYLGIVRGEKILDYGCAKGYLVKALRLLYRDAWGLDISQYAIDHSEGCCYLKEGNIVHNSYLTFPSEFDLCIAKDVFEHILDIDQVLEWIPANRLFVIVPLGDRVKFNVPVNNFDKTHCNCWDIDIWIEII